MDDEESDEETDDPTATTATTKEIQSISIHNSIKDIEHEQKSMIIADDIIYLCFAWLTPSELHKSQLVCKCWLNISKDSNLWQFHCQQIWNQFMIKKKFATKMRKKYQNSYYNYFNSHLKMRFDGVYILKVLYFIESEPALITNDIPSPYTPIEYYRYLRFLPPMNNGSECCKAYVLYAMNNRKPSAFQFFDCFQYFHDCHRLCLAFDEKVLNSSLIAKSKGEKVYCGTYEIGGKQNKNSVQCSIKTDYGLILNFDFSFIENDRLSMQEFYGISFDKKTGGILNSDLKMHFEVRHEPFLFISDHNRKHVAQYFA